MLHFRLEAAACSNGAYYGFFFFVEVKPFRYTRALEAVVFFSVVASAVRMGLISFLWSQWVRVGALALVIVAVLLVAYKDLGPRYHFVETFALHVSHQDRMSIGLDGMHPAKSLVQQIASRVAYCELHSNQKILISLPYEHPFCGIDLGSIYNSGFRYFPDELRFKGVRESSGPIFVSSGLSGDLMRLGFECAPEAKHYALCQRRVSGGP